MQPTVSVITPTKNRRALLGEAMDSVAAQSFSNWEHLIIDDGSEDGTNDEVAHRAELDPRVRYIERVGDITGANICRNIGIRESRGEYIVFLDSDDLLMRCCLAERVKVLQRNLDLDFATFQTGFFVDNVGDRRQEKPEELYGDDLLRFLTFDLPWVISAPIWRREALMRLEGFDNSLPSWQDVDLHIRAICAGMVYMRVPLVDHHVRWQFEEDKVSVQQRRSPAHLLAAEATLAKFEHVVLAGPGLDWVRQRALCGLYFFLAQRWAEVGDRAGALRAWKLASLRELAPDHLYWMGNALLRLKCTGIAVNLVGRVVNKWMGYVRMRANPNVGLKLSANRLYPSEARSDANASRQRTMVPRDV